MAQLLHHFGAPDEKFKFRHHGQKEFRIVQYIALHNAFPGAQGRFIDLIDGRMECQCQCGFLVVRLLFAERNQVRNAGIGIILEAETENLVDHITGLERLCIDGKHTGSRGTQLRIQVDTNRDRPDFTHALGQLT